MKLEGLIKYYDKKKDKEKIKELEKILENKYIYISGARTSYSRLMQLDKEQLIKIFLQIRNEINQYEKQIKMKNKIIDKMASFIEVFELDEEIAKNYCKGTYIDCKHKDDKGSCKSCITEYFEQE